MRDANKSLPQFKNRKRKLFSQIIAVFYSPLSIAYYIYTLLANKFSHENSNKVFQLISIQQIHIILLKWNNLFSVHLFLIMLVACSIRHCPNFSQSETAIRKYAKILWPKDMVGENEVLRVLSKVEGFEAFEIFMNAVNFYKNYHYLLSKINRLKAILH